MTKDQIANIEAGPECDRAVAEACGLNAKTGRGGVLHVINCEWKMFCPSTDLNDAFFAAERVGLFEWGNTDDKFSGHCGRWVGKENDGVWSVAVVGWSGSIDEIEGKAPTAALAICRAILILKAESP